MTYGLLGSIIPQINQNTVVFIAPVNTLAYGKVSISSKNPSPSRIRLGIASLNQNDPVRYLEYNKTINYGEAFETNTIYLGNGEKLVVRSDNSDVNFVFYGETFDESLQPVKSGLVGIITSTNNQKQVLYQVPSNAQGLLSISVCNLGSQICKARIGISSVSFPVGSGTSQYLEYDIEINPNQTYTRTDLKLQENQRLTCSSDDNSTVNFVCYGRLIYDVNKFVVDGDTILDGNLGIGTTANGYKLRVGGNTFIDGPINVSGVSTFSGLVDINNSVDILTDLKVSGVVTATSFVGALTGTLTNCTSLPISGLTSSTSTALGVGTLELGHASDTTLSRSSAGVLAVEGVVVPTVSSASTLTNKTLTSPVLASVVDVTGRYAQTVVAVPSLDIDCSAGNYFTKTINGSSTFTFSNVPASRAFSFVLEITHNSGTVTWPATVKFPKDTAPTLTTGKTHLFIFVTDDGGTRFRGASLVDYVN